MEPPCMDWRKIRGARSRNRFTAPRSRRAAPGAEVPVGQSLAHRALGASGNLRLAPCVVRTNSRTRKRLQYSRARAVSFARRIRALLHARRPAWRIYPTYACGRGAHRSRDRIFALRTTSSRPPGVVCKGSEKRSRLRIVGLRPTRRRCPRVPQAAIRISRVTASARITFGERCWRGARLPANVPAVSSRRQ